MLKLKQYLHKVVLVPVGVFVIWRALFGLYFLYYSVRMIPYAAEIYGNNGLVSNIVFNWTYGLFPTIFSIISTQGFIVGIHVLLALLGILLSCGVFPRLTPLLIWYIQTSLYNRNNLTDDPSQAFVGLLLLTLALIPSQPKLLTRSKKDIQIPFFVFFGPIFVFCVAFTVSAIDKITSISWGNGTAFWQMLHLGIARHTNLVEWLIVHQNITHIVSYVAVLTQFVCLPFFLIGKYRWSLVINFLSFSIMFVLFDLNQVIYGMLFFYSFFLLNMNWSYCRQMVGRWLPIKRYSFLPTHFEKGQAKK